MRKISSIVFCLFLVPLAAMAQSGETYSYIFPGIAADTDIAIANLNKQSASATVAFYRAAGDVVSVAFLIEPGRQTRVNSTSAGVSDFSGSAVISSGLALTVSASRFYSDTPFDFILPSEPGSTLSIPFAPLDSSSIDINVFNPGTEQADVKVVPIKQDGTQESVVAGLVDPKQTTVFHLPTTAGVSQIMLRTSGLLRGARPIVANAHIYSYQPEATGAVLRTDFAVVPAIPASAATTATTIPFFSHGQDYFSVVQVVNLSASSQTVTLTARRADGTTISGTKNPLSVELAAWGATRQLFAGMFGITVTELTTGHITVEGTEPLNAAVGIGYVSQSGFTVLPADERVFTSFAFSLRRTGREFFTGLTFINKSNRIANLSMSFVGDDGKTLSTVPLSVPSAQQVVGTLADLFPEAQGNGFIFVSSDSPVTAAGVEGRATGSALGVRRPLYAPSTFTVAPQERYLAVGTVFEEDAGVSNIAIRLSGPVEASALTDSTGQFVFRDLPSGTYRLTPIPIGYSITPVERSFTISNANSRRNDFSVGLTAPVLTRISPDGQVVNADSTEITVEGTNFISGEVVVFEVTELPTTFVSDTRLTAVIDRSLLTASGDVPVVVRNRGPSGSIVDSNPLAFTIGNAAPILATITGQPSPLIAGTVNASFTITVTGSGFTPASQVQVDRVARNTIFISPTELRATILPADVGNPGFVPVAVRNPGAPASTPFQLPVLYPSPRLVAISPSALTALVALDAQAVRIGITGSGFIRDASNASITSRVLVDNVPVITEFVSPSQLVGIVPANLLSVAGVKSIAVKNPEPTVGASDALPLYVSHPVPVVTSLEAGPVTYNAGSTETIWLPVLINGQNFSSESVAWVSLPCDTSGYRRAQITTRISARQLLATIPIRCAGPYLVQVRTAQPGGGTSNTVALSVGASSQ